MTIPCVSSIPTPPNHSIVLGQNRKLTGTHGTDRGIVGKDLTVGSVQHLTLEAGLVVDTKGVDDTLGTGLLLIQAHTADPLASVT